MDDRLKESWLTRPLFVCPPRVKRVLKVTGVMVLILGIFSPGLVTLGWHLRHGSSISSPRGMTVFLPLAWTANLDDSNSVVLTKLPIA